MKLARHVRQRLRHATSDTERGLTTLEIVIWAGGLLAVALLVLGALNGVIQDYLGDLTG